jgi:LysR family transcriptional regulator, cell division regulator
MSNQRYQLEIMASPSDLQYFLETATLLNFSRAAERLSIAQPSLSQAMHRLETAIGASLFSRHKRGVTLTPAGQQLLIHTRSLLQSWDEVKQNAQSSMSEIRGRFTIGCHPSVAIMLLNSFLPSLLKSPDIEIHLVHDMSAKITDQVISSAVDIGLVVNPIRHPDLIITKLYDDEVLFWMAEAMAKRKASILKGATVIYDPSRLTQMLFQKKAKDANINVVRTIESRNLEVIAHLTSGGCGIGVLPTRVAQSAPTPLVKLASSPIFRDDICLIMRVEGKKVAALQYISNLIKESANA